MGHVVSDLLKTGYLLRRPALDDAPRVHALLTAVEMAEFGGPGDTTVADLLDAWRRLDLARDAWLVVAPDGELAGFGSARRRQVVRNDVVGYVHPAHAGCSIGTTLVRLAETWARDALPHAAPGAEVFVTNWINARNGAACALLEREGYRAVRYFWRMGLALNSVSALPSWPSGIAVGTAAELADLRPVYEIVEESMADHWGHVAVPFAQWVERHAGLGFDPHLWFLALEGDVPAGAVLCRSAASAGWVDTLVVRRAYRQQGLGSALLALAFSALAQRGHQQAHLIVDADNLTGATRLYERAGMQIEQTYAAYRKLLGEGG
jgi:ribosomal protein S18 acetylase RimI-like enzyme